MSPKLSGPSLPVVLLAALVLLTSSPVSRAETVYVSDDLIINFRSLPSNQGRIVKLLPSGTPLDVIERQQNGEWARVRTRGGDEGWVLQQYVQDQPVAADRLKEANREVERLTSAVADLKERLNTVQSARSEAEQSSSDLGSRVEALQSELAEIKRASAGALETAAENQRLGELNARLRSEMDDLVKERDELAANTRQRWLMIGGGLVLTGLFLGMVMKSRPRRSAWS